MQVEIDGMIIEFDKQEFLWQEYNRYIQENKLTPYERRLLHKWVSEGNSVSESPGSCFSCECYPPKDFIETYREDKLIRHEMKGMTRLEKENYLKEYMGYTD